MKNKQITSYAYTVLSALVLCGAVHAASDGDLIETNPGLRRRAIQETAVPVRPGVPGESPFWNGKAVQFLYAPAFDFKEVPGAKLYRFTVAPSRGEPLSFTADKPWAPLSPIWTQVLTGKATLTVTGLDAQGAPVGEPMTRTFHRAAAIGKEYPAPAMSWDESARTALDALVHSEDFRCWFTTGEPDPKVHLYRYPSKIVGAAASSLATYAAQTPPPADADEALTAARRAADYLLSLSFPADAAWAYHPPTYHPSMYGEKLRGHMGSGRHMTKYGAVAGQYYLDVYAATEDEKYLDAAIRIAETYAQRQLPEGSWTLLVMAQDGTPVTENLVVPTPVIEFLDRLGKVTGDHRFDAMREKAIGWIRNNPVRTWNWQGQFEDVKPMPPYMNLTKHEACSFAIHLLHTSPDNPTDRALALDLLRFSEDQFVIWAQPPHGTPVDPTPDGAASAKSASWMLPCVLEQYRCYAPVCASSAKLMRTYLAAYRVTGDSLHLEKAKALAATLTRTQAHPKAGGRYLTWVKKSSGPMWFNAELYAIHAMKELADCVDAPVSVEAGTAEAADKPNILWLIVEDESLDQGCYGNTLVQTPNIDSLAKEGVRFSHAFCTGPVCAPSRSAFITGMYQTTIGAQHFRLEKPTYHGKGLPDNNVWLPKGVEPITWILERAGYSTANVVERKELKASGKDHYAFHLERPAFQSKDWNDLSRKQPFYAQVNFGRTHRIGIGAMTDPDKSRFSAPSTIDPDQVELPPYYPDHPTLKRDWANYLDDICALDENVGAVIGRLKQEGLWDNTIVIFFSDHGRPMPRAKFWLYDSSLRVPLIVRIPEKWRARYGVAPGTTDDRLVSLIDVSATTLDMAGLSKPEYMQGRVFLGPNREADREFVVGARDDLGVNIMRSRTVRDQWFRYIRNYNPEISFKRVNPAWNEICHPHWVVMRQLQNEGKLTPEQAFILTDRLPDEELYDVENDPFEIHNLAANPKYADTLKRLRATLDEWVVTSGDRGGEPSDPKLAEGSARRNRSLRGLYNRAYFEPLLERGMPVIPFDELWSPSKGE